MCGTCAKKLNISSTLLVSNSHLFAHSLKRRFELFLVDFTAIQRKNHEVGPGHRILKKSLLFFFENAKTRIFFSTNLIDVHTSFCH